MQVGILEIYLLKASIYMLLFYIFNKLLISRDTLHRLSRFVWLSTLVLSLVLPCWVIGFEPLVSLPVEQEVLPMVEGMEIGAGVVIESREGDYTMLDYLLTISFIVYLLGLITIFVIKAKDYSRLLRLILPKAHRWYDPKYQKLILECEGLAHITHKVHYIVHQEPLSPFSWMNYVVISRGDLAGAGGREILLHELSHVKMRHSWDIVLLDLLALLFWFNPVVWLIKRELQLLQEYEADQNVLDSGVDARTYQLLLIKKAIGIRHYTMSNSLNHSNLKNRITMMIKKRSSKWVMAKSLYTIPVALVVMSAYGAPAISKEVDEISGSKFTNFFVSQQVNGENNSSEVQKLETPKFDTLYVAENDEGGIGRVTTNKAELEKPASVTITVVPPTNYEDSVFVAPQVMARPLFLGENATLNDFRVWMSEQLKSDGKTEGQLITSFIIEKDGSVSNVRIVRSLNEEVDAEVVEIVKRSGKWSKATNDGKAVRSTYMFPMVFSLASKSEQNGE